MYNRYYKIGRKCSNREEKNEGGWRKERSEKKKKGEKNGNKALKKVSYVMHRYKFSLTNVITT